MDETLGGMFKLTDPSYSVWKSKMRDMLVCKNLWLHVQYGKDRANKIDALTWEAMHLKAGAYIRCFIDMSLYNNFNDETEGDVMGKKIWRLMFEMKKALNGHTYI